MTMPDALRNVILIGMPGCESGVGAVLAKLSGRVFVDPDLCIQLQERSLHQSL